MSKTLPLIGLLAALALPPAALAASSSYGTQNYGYGPNIPTRSLTPFDRSWNANNESKRQARAGAEWMRRHNRHFPTPW